MKTSCTVCGADVFAHEFACVRCTSPQGFPNVRMATSRDERDQLLARVEQARGAADRAGATKELDRLAAIAGTASIAFNRTLEQLFIWCAERDQNFRPWTWQVANGRRIYPDEFNLGRIAFEHNVNPNFSDNINFGYLDIGNTDLTNYGPYKVCLSDNAVFKRTTFLEKNAYLFCHEHGVVEAMQMPRGYRSTWDDRGLLAVAKLGDKVQIGMADPDLGRLLLRDDAAPEPADFLEAHIYNPIHLSAITSVRGPAAAADDVHKWEFVRSSLTRLGVTVEVRK